LLHTSVSAMIGTSCLVEKWRLLNRRLLLRRKLNGRATSAKRDS
jgi:hypothetical protein